MPKELTPDEVDATADGLYEKATKIRDAGDHRTAFEMAIAGMRMVRNDIQHRLARRDLAEQNADLVEKSETDALTGLLNLNGYNRAMKHELAEMRRFDGHMVGLAYVDLDGFKAINDTFGHATGDKVLKDVAKRLEECFRTTDMVCRIGGDELVIIMPYKDNNHFPEREVVADWIRDSLSGLYEWDEENQEPYPIGASIGIVSTNDPEIRDLSEVDDLMVEMKKVADQRMYQDKWYNGEYTEENKHELFHPKNERLESLRLKAALDHDGLTIAGPFDLEI